MYKRPVFVPFVLVQHVLGTGKFPRGEESWEVARGETLGGSAHRERRVGPGVRLPKWLHGAPERQLNDFPGIERVKKQVTSPENSNQLIKSADLVLYKRPVFVPFGFVHLVQQVLGTGKLPRGEERVI